MAIHTSSAPSAGHASVAAPHRACGVRINCRNIEADDLLSDGFDQYAAQLIAATYAEHENHCKELQCMYEVVNGCFGPFVSGPTSTECHMCIF